MQHSAINIEALEYIVVAAQVGKLSRAAKVLGVETATLSRKVAAVENELGLTVFERGTSGIRATSGGKRVIALAQRVMADLDALRKSGQRNAAGEEGQIRLGVRMPTVGGPAQNLLRTWRERFPGVELVLHEMNERDLVTAIGERRLDVAFMTKHTLWPHAAAIPVWRERLLVALPIGHQLLTRRKALSWDHLRDETFLVQGWDESQSAREFFASLLGSGVRFRTHSASKQTVLSLVAAGFGATLVTQSQSEVRIPRVVFRPIAERNAQVEVELVWVPENEEAVVGRFVAFMRDEARSRGLF